MRSFPDQTTDDAPERLLAAFNLPVIAIAGDKAEMAADKPAREEIQRTTTARVTTARVTTARVTTAVRRPPRRRQASSFLSIWT